MNESLYANYRFRGRLESNAEDPQEAWACLRWTAAGTTGTRRGRADR